MSWNLRYAPHLGFRSLEMPLFPASTGSADPLAQIAFAASLGFAGVQDPWFATRPRPIQDAVAERVAALGLAAGCIVCGTPASARTPLWNTPGEGARSRVEAELRTAFDAAQRLGARQIAVLTGQDPDAPRERQIETMIGRLAWAAPLAESEGVTICVEPTNARVLTGMLLSHYEDGCAVVRAAGHKALRMIFDTAHIQSMDGDLLGHLERSWDLVEIVQIANHPLRTEPEIGEIQMATILRRVHERGFAGLVELEHLWARPGLAAERRAIEWLRRTDGEFTITEKGQ